MDEGGGAAPIEQGGEGDAAAVGFDQIPADDLLFGVISAFDEDVGADGVKEGDGGVVVEEDEIVDAFELFEDGDAVVLVDDGAFGAFEALDAGVGVDGDDEDVALAFSEAEVLDVAEVDEVEAAVGEDDFSAEGSVALEFG